MERSVKFIGHDTGAVDNIHSFKNEVEPIDENKSSPLLTKCRLGNVSKFRELSKQYYKDNQQKRFPSSYYWAEGETKNIGDMFEQIHTSPNTRILKGYNPIKHLEVFGFEDKDFDDYSLKKDLSFENTITILSPEKSLIVLNVVVNGNDIDEVKEQLKKCNDMVKAVYAANHKNISNQHVTIVGTIIFPSTSNEQLQAANFPFLSFFKNVIFLCKDNVNSKEHLQDWWDDLCSLSLRQSSDDQHQAIRYVAGEMMASMSIISSYLPKVTEDVGEKIATLLLNPDQVAVIMDETKWKVITGPYGSGKSVCLKEIARRLHDRNDESKIIYICFDPFSLSEAETNMFFKKTISDDGRLQSLSLVEISSNAGYSVDQFYNYYGPPEKNIAEVFKYLKRTANIGHCHILVDEFHDDNIDKQYCDSLKDCLNENFFESTVVIATQSVTTLKEVINQDNEVTYEQCSLENAGMKLLAPLKRTMRNPKNIFYLTKVAVKEVQDTETLLPLPNVDRNVNSVSSNFITSYDISRGEDDISRNEDVIPAATNAIANDGNQENKQTNVYELSDPLMLAKQYPDNLPIDSTRKVRSKSTFVPAECGTINSSIKPKLIYLPNNYPIDIYQSCKIFSKVIEELILNASGKITFICNNVDEIIFIKYVLEDSGHQSITYAPYILKQLPSSEEKREVVKSLNKKVDSHLITDYRSFRGCETSNCVSFVDPDSKYGHHVMIEVITRATSKLDLIIVPSTKSNNELSSCWSKILNNWTKCDGLVDEIKVQVESHEILEYYEVKFGDNSFEVEPNKTDEDNFATIQKSVRQEEDNSDKRNHMEFIGSKFENRMSFSTAWVGTKWEYWIRVYLAIAICLKEGLVGILHNVVNDPSYHGLPSDPYQLFQCMQRYKQNKKHGLHKILRQDQWNVLCPPNQQQTNSNNWDITLLVAVIRFELKLQPLGGWNIKQLQINDRSKGAFVYLIRNLRNEIKYGSIDEINLKFTAYWNRIEFILIGINYKNLQSFYNLETEPLDQNTILITNIEQMIKVLKKLQIDSNKLSNEVEVLKKLQIDSNKLSNEVEEQ